MPWTGRLDLNKGTFSTVMGTMQVRRFDAGSVEFGSAPDDWAGMLDRVAGDFPVSRADWRFKLSCAPANPQF